MGKRALQSSRAQGGSRSAPEGAHQSAWIGIFGAALRTPARLLLFGVRGKKRLAQDLVVVDGLLGRGSGQPVDEGFGRIRLCLRAPLGVRDQGAVPVVKIPVTLHPNNQKTFGPVRMLWEGIFERPPQGLSLSGRKTGEQCVAAPPKASKDVQPEDWPAQGKQCGGFGADGDLFPLTAPGTITEIPRRENIPGPARRLPGG